MDNRDQTNFTTLNRWLIALVIGIIIWIIGIVILIEQKADRTIMSTPPVIPKILSSNVVASATATVTTIKSNSFNKVKPLFEQKKSYDVQDVIIINHFWVEGIVVEKLNENTYTIMYKDHNHVLQKITLPKEFLLSPTSKNSISPISLLVD